MDFQNLAHRTDAKDYEATDTYEYLVTQSLQHKTSQALVTVGFSLNKQYNGTG